MLYHKIRDPLHVMQKLGHKKLESTLLYIQLEQVLFDETSDQFTVKVAETKDRITELLEAGFEYVCEKDNLVYFRKRK